MRRPQSVRTATVASHVADVTKPDDAHACGGDRRSLRWHRRAGPRCWRWRWREGDRHSTDEKKSRAARWRSNLLQRARMMRLALPHMRDRAGAAVVNISSISGWSPQLAGSGPYGAARRRYFDTERWALEFVPHDLRVNTVSPGSHPRRRQWLISLSPGEPGELRRLRAARISDGPSRQSRRGCRCGRVPGVAAGALDQWQEHSGGWARAAIRRTRPASVLRSARPLW